VRELRSFYALSIINLAFGAVAMTISVSFSIQNVLAIVDAKNLFLPQLVFCILEFLAFGLSLRWLLTRVEILDGVRFLFGLVHDATTTVLGVSSNLAFEMNPPVAQRLANPALFIASEAGLFFITIAAFQLFIHIQRNYNVHRSFIWSSYIIIVLVCSLHLFIGLYNVNAIIGVFNEIT
jgi:hypothetical protein